MDERASGAAGRGRLAGTRARGKPEERDRDHGPGDRAGARAGPGRVPAHQQLRPSHRGALAPGLGRPRPGLRRGPAPGHPARRGGRLRPRLVAAPRLGGLLACSGAVPSPSRRRARSGGSPWPPCRERWSGCSSTTGRRPPSGRPCSWPSTWPCWASCCSWPTGRRDRGRASAEVSTRDALLIGLAQAAAIVPGVSRSGATISAALFLGLRAPRRPRASASCWPRPSPSGRSS